MTIELLTDRAFPTQASAVRLQVEAGWTFFWETLFEKSAWHAWVIGANAWGFVVYWLFGLFWTALDLYAPESLLKFKVQQPPKHAPLEKDLLIECVKALLINQLLVGPLLAVAVFPYIAKFGVTYETHEIPPLKDFAIALGFYALVEEVGFYWSHRLLHESKFLYKRVHKQHHLWVSPVAISARYAHPLEDVLSNLSPLVGGPVLFGSHMIFAMLWVSYGLINTLNAHSGWHLPFQLPAEEHDYHHQKFTEFYGPTGFFDTLCGTNDKFKNSVWIDRSVVLTQTTKSAHELYPAPVKKK